MSTMFDRIFGLGRGGLLRGTQMGDALDAVVARESADCDMSHSPDRFTLTVSGLADPSYGLSYNIYYVYNADKVIQRLSVSVQYNQYVDNLPPFAEFSALLKAVSAMLKERYGKPEVVEEKTKFVGKEKFEKWFPQEELLKKVLLATYAEPRNKIKKAFRVDYSPFA